MRNTFILEILYKTEKYLLNYFMSFSNLECNLCPLNCLKVVYLIWSCSDVNQIGVFKRNKITKCISSLHRQWWSSEYRKCWLDNSCQSVWYFSLSGLGRLQSSAGNAMWYLLVNYYHSLILFSFWGGIIHTLVFSIRGDKLFMSNVSWSPWYVFVVLFFSMYFFLGLVGEVLRKGKCCVSAFLKHNSFLFPCV